MKCYKCEKCGNTFAVIKDSGVKPICCGSEMKETEIPDNSCNK